MVDRFLAIKDSIDPSDVELTCLLPTLQQSITIQNLFESLKDFFSVTLALEKTGMNLHKTRTIFNLLIENYNIMVKYVGENASVIHSKAFERGVCKLISGNNGVLTAEEKLVVSRFRKVPPSLTDKALLMAKNTKEINYEYQRMDWLNPTSNVLERLFSRGKMVLSDHRMSMLPVNLEQTLFL